MRNIRSQRNQSGNILIYILGAIFLIGLLTVMVRGASTPGANIDEESLLLRVAEVQQYGQELERAVAYVMRNAHSEADIRFAHLDADLAYGDVTDVPTRQVFSRDGGGAKYREPPSDIQTTPTNWLFSGANIVQGIGTDCGTSECAELIAFLPYVTERFCTLVNEKNDVAEILNIPPSIAVANITAPFTGTFDGTNPIQNPENSFNYKKEGCFQGSGTPPTGTYHYYRVLLAR